MKNYLLHKNGFGKKYDSAEADARTFLSSNSELRGDTDVFEAVITDSSIINNCYIYLAHIEHSKCVSTTITGRIRLKSCMIKCRSIAGSLRAFNAVIVGESRISGTAEISNSYFKDLTVGGDAKILNWSKLEDQPIECNFGRIFSGIWERPPRIFYLELSKEIVTESTNGRAFVGCMEGEIKKWLKTGDRFGRMKGWSSEQILELRLVLENLADNPMPTN